MSMRIIALVLAGAAGSCDGAATKPILPRTATVVATAETEPVGTVNRDAADDPAIWRNPARQAHRIFVQNLEPICAGVIAGGALMGIAVILVENFVLGP